MRLQWPHSADRRPHGNLAHRCPPQLPPTSLCCPAPHAPLLPLDCAAQAPQQQGQAYQAVPAPQYAPPPAPEGSFWSRIPPLVYIGVGALCYASLSCALATYVCPPGLLLVCAPADFVQWWPKGRPVALRSPAAVISLACCIQSEMLAFCPRPAGVVLVGLLGKVNEDGQDLCFYRFSILLFAAAPIPMHRRCCAGGRAGQGSGGCEGRPPEDAADGDGADDEADDEADGRAPWWVLQTLTFVGDAGLTSFDCCVWGACGAQQAACDEAVGAAGGRAPGASRGCCAFDQLCRGCWPL